MTAECTIVHLVHGTWGRGVLPVILEELGRRPRLSKSKYWFEEGSAFHRGVRQHLGDKDVEFRTFTWSGSNSFAARTHAAAELKLYLEQQFKQEPDAVHLLLGHSHAGNVFVECLTGQAGTPIPARVLTLATPFLAIESTSGLRSTMYMLVAPCFYFYLAALALCLLISARFYEAGWFSFTLLGYWLTFHARRLGKTATCLVAALASVLAGLCIYHGLAPFIHGGQAGSRFAELIQAASPALRALLVLLNTAFLALAALAGSIRPPAFMLRDLTQCLAAFYAAVVVVAAAIWAYFNPTHETGASILERLLVVGPLCILAWVRTAASKPWLDRRFQALWRAQQQELQLVQLPCPLDAVRLPRDEASVAIIAAGLARVIAESPVRFLRSSASRMLLMFLVSLSIIAAAYQIIADRAHGFDPPLVLLLVLPLALAFFGAYSSILLIPFLVVAASLALVLIGFSVGPEVFESMAGANVVCEPLPRCSQQNVTLFMLWPTLEDRLNLPMRHSMYDLPLVQKWVADWILTSVSHTS